MGPASCWVTHKRLESWARAAKERALGSTSPKRQENGSNSNSSNNSLEVFCLRCMPPTRGGYIGVLEWFDGWSWNPYPPSDVTRGLALLALTVDIFYLSLSDIFYKSYRRESECQQRIYFFITFHKHLFPRGNYTTSTFLFTTTNIFISFLIVFINKISVKK